MTGQPLTSLRGLTVIDLSHYLAGSTATVILADLGARVIKVESSGRPDGIRRQIPRPAGTMRRPVSYQLIRDKEHLDLDLKSAAGRSRLEDLVRESDVLVENFSAGTLDRLGIGFAWLSSVNPALSLVSIRAFTTGTDLDAIKAGAPSIQAMTGVDAALGTMDGRPLALGRPTGDMVAGIDAALAVVAAWRRARVTGRGGHVTVGIDRALRQLFVAGMAGQGRHGAGPTGCPHAFFRCRGHEEWLALSCNSEAEWRALVAATVGDRVGNDPRYADRFLRKVNSEALHREFDQWFEGITLADAVDRLSGRGVTFMPLLAPERQLTTELFSAAATIVVRPDDEVGDHPTVRHFARVS
ncbi:CaiB/BaiF CoA transferase family protein [Luedemannella helvata]|uniref:CaiB/BaiF CoA-transferase family protein n=1 Tax=Luedemannella helvata TaxID=349315 RepID=A0ABN2JXE6_9ACTN